jgi:glycosyltransferase involved in cell wall biosynthesis
MGLLSIVVLCYNRIDYTKRTITNLIEKTNIKYELILVDNNSSDDTKDYLLSLKNKTNAVRLKYVFNKRNYGVAGGRNSGLINARGDYLMTIDNDILVPDDYDEYIVKTCGIKNLGITGINVEGKQYPITNIDGVKVQLKKENLGGGSLCLPRRVFNRVGYFSPDFVYGGEDCDMHIRIKKLGLLGAYILPSGKHIEENQNKVYKDFKREAHKSDSNQVKMLALNNRKYEKKNTVYVSYKIPKAFRTKDGRLIK